MSPEERVELHQKLTNHFNESELRTLCFGLGVDYDDLPGQGKADKARELILYFERCGQIVALVQNCARLRSHVSWEFSTLPILPLESRPSDKGDDEVRALKHRRLHELRKQQAIKGINTPPEVLIEIEELERELQTH